MNTPSLSPPRRYAQSSACRSLSDSSVSYASAVAWRVDAPEPVWRNPSLEPSSSSNGNGNLETGVESNV